MPNGIDLILADHRRVAELFTSFESRPDGATVGLIVDALEAHDAAEHAALYPMLGRLTGDAAAVERAANAHSAVKKQIEVLAGLEGTALIDAVIVLRALVEGHVADEEDALLPALAGAASGPQLEELGARLLQAKQRVG